MSDPLRLSMLRRVRFTAFVAGRPHAFSVQPANPVEQNSNRPFRETVHMARITLRQLLDHAAEHGYGVPAFNINNMEQGLAIMEAANAVDAPVIMQASRGARSYANDIVLKHLIDAAGGDVSAHPVCMHQDHGNNAGDLRHRDPVRLHQRDDGRLAEGRRQDAGRLRLQRRASPAASSTWPTGSASRSRASSACWAAWRPAWARRRTATASRASSATTSC